MKNKALISWLVGILALAGCCKKDDVSPPAGSTSATTSVSDIVTVEITANDSMKYSINSIEAKPGQEVKVTLTNIGTMPKSAMGHNFVLLEKGVDPNEFVDAAAATAEADYIPESMKDKVIAHTKLLGPKQSDEITFKAPTEPGDYTFLCSFPAHFNSGMHGVLAVKAEGVPPS